MKKVRYWLKNNGAYEYIKYSPIFRLYEYIFKPAIATQETRETALYKSFLAAPTLIFDIGAYDGHKTAAFLALGSKVICCEPDTYNLRLLKIRFRRFLKSRVCIEGLALGETATEGNYYIHHHGSAFNTLNPRWKDILEKDGVNRWNEKISFSPEQHKVTITTLDLLINKYGRPDYIKIDAEGSEFMILQGLSAGVNYISFECLLPEFASDLSRCIAKIKTLSSNALFNIIYNEELILTGFADESVLREWIANCQWGCFEVLACSPNAL